MEKKNLRYSNYKETDQCIRCKFGKNAGLWSAFSIYFLYDANVFYHIFEKNGIIIYYL